MEYLSQCLGEIFPHFFLTTVIIIINSTTQTKALAASTVQHERQALAASTVQHERQTLAAHIEQTTPATTTVQQIRL